MRLTLPVAFGHDIKQKKKKNLEHLKNIFRLTWGVLRHAWLYVSFRGQSDDHPGFDYSWRNATARHRHLRNTTWSRPHRRYTDFRLCGQQRWMPLFTEKCYFHFVESGLSIKCFSSLSIVFAIEFLCTTIMHSTFQHLWQRKTQDDQKMSYHKNCNDQKYFKLSLNDQLSSERWMCNAALRSLLLLRMIIDSRAPGVPRFSAVQEAASHCAWICTLSPQHPRPSASL